MDTQPGWIIVDATWDATIYVWPDYTWCFEDDYTELGYGHSKSDDFAILRLAELPGGETIEELVERHCNYTGLSAEEQDT